MKHIKYYIENYRFINKVLLLDLKYIILIKLMSNKALMQKIINLSTSVNNNPYQDQNRNLALSIKKNINKIFKILPWSHSCLIRELIYYHFFTENSIYPKIEFGIIKLDDKILAHCWNSLSPSDQGRFKKVGIL